MSTKMQWPCDVDDGDVRKPCWAAEQTLMDPGAIGGNRKGVERLSMVNMTTHKFSRHLHSLRSGQHSKKGLRMNFCPFCGADYRRASDVAAIAARRSRQQEAG